MSYLSYHHRTFGEVVMRIHNWEIPSILKVIASINSKDEVISHVTTKSI